MYIAGVFCFMDITSLYNLWKASSGISTDTRKIERGQIFFALKGENFDGNLYAFKALESGAAYAVVDSSELNHHQDGRLIHVNNVLSTLQALARYHRDQMDIPVLGITGSNGKTTTKELTRDVLAKRFRVFATKGNLNNHIGVPLTILSAPYDTEFLIIEMGANHQGEIEALCNIADIDYCMITNIGKAHLEGFGGVQGIMKGKSEMYRYVAAKAGKIFVNTDDKVLMSLIPNHVHTIEYSNSELHLVGENQNQLSFEYNNKMYDTHLYGAYNINNIAFAMACGRYFEVNENDILDAVTSYVPDNNRSQLLHLNTNTVIMDAYNANPSSMKESLESFSKMEGKKVVVLGDMLELGEYSEEEHLKIIRLVKELHFEEAIFIGPQFCSIATPSVGKFFNNTEEAAIYFKSKNYQNTNILLKGSRGISVEKILS